MSPWISRIFDFVSGGPHASTAETLLRGALVGCSLFATIQLLTMIGTRWGNRNAMSKAFFLSVLIHLCLGLGGAIIEENHRLATAATDGSSEAGSSDEESRIRVREVRIDGNESSLPENESQAPAWQRSLRFSGGPFSRRQESSFGLPPVPAIPERSPQKEITVDLPRVAVSEPQPRMAERKEPVPPPTRTTEVGPPVQKAAEPVVDRRPETNSAPRQQRADRSKSPAPAVANERPSKRPSEQPPIDLTRVDSLSGPDSVTSSSQPNPQSRPADPAGIGSGSPSRSTAKRNPKPAGPPVEKAPEIPVVRGIVRGVVTDSVTGLPLPSATIRFDQAQGDPLTATTKEDGTYELRVAAASENSAVTATSSGYLPESHNLRSADLRRKTARLDFVLKPANESVIAVEQDPVVHHLGNDRFEGLINSQFQRKSEGTTYVAEFRMSRAQARLKRTRAVITLMVRGVQCQPDIRINGTLLARRSDKSPADGSYGTLALPFAPALLREGENEIRVESVNCNGDLDDFEFVNVQIRLSRPEQ